MSRPESSLVNSRTAPENPGDVSVNEATCPPAVEEFITRWKGKDGGERSNYQLFISELCDLLEVPRAYIERLVLPTVIEPLRREWAAINAHVRELIGNALECCADLPSPSYPSLRVRGTLLIIEIASADEMLKRDLLRASLKACSGSESW